MSQDTATPTHDRRHARLSAPAESRAFGFGRTPTYRVQVDVQQPERERSSWNVTASVKHGYPPPRLSPGSITTAYCGEQMIVEGEVSDQPPRDACPLCALAWRSRHKRHSRP